VTDDLRTFPAKNRFHPEGECSVSRVRDAKVRIDVPYCTCCFLGFPFSSSPIFNHASRCTSSKRSSASLIQ